MKIYILSITLVLMIIDLSSAQNPNILFFRGNTEPASYYPTNEYLETVVAFCAQAKQKAVNKLFDTVSSRLIGFEEYDGRTLADKEEYTYSGNNGGDLTHLLKYSGINSFDSNNESGTLAKAGATIQNFDDKGNINSIITQVWDSKQNSCINLYRYIFFYNANNIVDSAITQFWNKQSFKWVNNAKSAFKYDSNYNLTMYDKLDWDISKTIWMPHYRNINTYDSHGNNTLQNFTEWDGKEWETYSQIICCYNSKDEDILELDTVYYSMSRRIIRIYNTKNSNDSLKIEQFYNKPNWTNSNRFIYEYDANNNDTACIAQGWNSRKSKWINGSEKLTTYNNYNQATSCIEKYWSEKDHWKRNYGGNRNFYYYETYPAIKPIK